MRKTDWSVVTSAVGCLVAVAAIGLAVWLGWEIFIWIVGETGKAWRS
jgi:hypothetical protein